MTPPNNENAPFPCECANGHRFTRLQAKAANFICTICTAAIVCEPIKPPPAPVDPEE
jgi:hypothetical protein